MKFLIQNIMLLTETTGWLSNIPNLEDYEVVAPAITDVDFIFLRIVLIGLCVMAFIFIRRYKYIFRSKNQQGIAVLWNLTILLCSLLPGTRIYGTCGHVINSLKCLIFHTAWNIPLLITMIISLVLAITFWLWFIWLFAKTNHSK